MTNRQLKIAETQKHIDLLEKKIQSITLAKQALETKLEIWKKQELNGEPDFRPKKEKQSQTLEKTVSSIYSQISSQEKTQVPQTVQTSNSLPSFTEQSTVPKRVQAAQFGI